MKLSEVRLKQIIREEVVERLIEIEVQKFRLVLREECARKGIILTEQQEDDAEEEFRKVQKDLRDAIRRSRIAAAKKAATLATVAGIGGGALAYGTEKKSQDVTQQQQDIATQAQIESSSDEAQFEDFVDYVNNPAAFRWGKGEAMAMSLPGTKGKVTVLPASYSIAVQALLDKKENLKRMEQGKKPLSRFETPDLEDLPSLRDKSTAKQKGDAKDNLEDFFTTYSNKDLMDVSPLLKSIDELQIVPGSGTEQMVVMVKPSSISPDYVLPKLEMTAAEYYDSQYYGQFLGSGEAESIMDLADEEMVVTPDPETELPPELIRRTKERAAKISK